MRLPPLNEFPEQYLEDMRLVVGDFLARQRDDVEGGIKLDTQFVEKYGHGLPATSTRLMATTLVLEIVIERLADALGTTSVGALEDIARDLARSSGTA